MDRTGVLTNQRKIHSYIPVYSHGTQVCLQTQTNHIIVKEQNSECPCGGLCSVLEGNWPRKTALLKLLSQFIVCVFQNIKGWIDPLKSLLQNLMPKSSNSRHHQWDHVVPLLETFNGFHLCWEPSLGMIYKCFDALCVLQSHLSSSPFSLPRISFDCPTGGCFQLLIHVSMLDPWHPFFYAPISSNNSLQWTILPTVEISLSSFLFSLQNTTNNLRAAIVSVGFIAYSQDLYSQCPVHHK